MAVLSVGLGQSDLVCEIFFSDYLTKKISRWQITVRNQFVYRTGVKQSARTPTAQRQGSLHEGKTNPLV